MAVEKLFSQNEKLLCGFYEIYNGQLYDLFNQNSRFLIKTQSLTSIIKEKNKLFSIFRLVLREDSAGLVNVVGLLEIQVKSIQQLRKVFFLLFFNTISAFLLMFNMCAGVRL
jgi:hypothetical protein